MCNLTLILDHMMPSAASIQQMCKVHFKFFSLEHVQTHGLSCLHYGVNPTTTRGLNWWTETQYREALAEQGLFTPV